MPELDQLGREVQEQLGEPSASWLRTQRQELRRALAAPREPGVGERRWLVVAAALLAVALGGVVWLASPRSAVAPLVAEMVLNAPSSERRVELADGSTLVLEPLSLARVSSGAVATRCVVEVGTLRFNVAPQRSRQFTVVAGAFEIRVVGTRFSVSRDAAGVVDVQVDHGVVRVLAPNRNAPIELEAGDRLQGDDSTLSLTHRAASPPTPSSVAFAEPRLPSAEPPLASSSTPPPSSVTADSDWQVLYRERDYAAALGSAKRLGVDHLLESLPARPLSELADAAWLGGDSELSLRAFESMERRFPASAQARDAVFLSGRVYAKRGQSELALARFEKYLARNARGAYSLEATGRLVELYAARGDERAKATARTYLERAPNGPYQRLCRSVLAAP